jgi:hypothetical protein
MAVDLKALRAELRERDVEESDVLAVLEDDGVILSRQTIITVLGLHMDTGFSRAAKLVDQLDEHLRSMVERRVLIRPYHGNYRRG